MSVRPSPIAGTWYSANPTQLRESVNTYIEKATPPTLNGEVIALVAPHAGYRYSGAVAGHAFKTVKGRSFDTVVIISPMHQYDPHPILTSAHRAYRTPLGDIPLAKQLITEISEALYDIRGGQLTPVFHDQEHSLEIELPFLQCALADDFDLIPIMLRDQTRQTAMDLGQVLAECLSDVNCLLVASSDLSHFHPESEAKNLDNQVLEALGNFSPEGLFELKDQGLGHACGLAAMACVLWASKTLGANNVSLLSYDTSASSTGDRSSVVGYGAVAITRPN